MRRAGITLLVLVVLFVLADFAVKRYEETTVAGAIQTSLDLQRRPSVTLQGFPFIAELARGHISAASLRADQVKQRSVTFSNVHLVVRRLTFSVREFLAGNLAAIHAAHGAGYASISNSAANAFLRSHSLPFEVAFERGKTIAKLGPVSAAVPVTMTIVNGSLRISAGSTALPSVTLSLPPIFNQVTYGSVTPLTGRLIVRFTMDHPSLDLRP
jgi:hypothetical protein